MDSTRPAVDLEGELTCSICTEVLYQPLTLLDCLHTFCGACLKDWFSWQAKTAERSPQARLPTVAAGARTATCPSCRATVRDTRHNATVATLLDMFLSANPEKVRTAADKADMDERYRPGDTVVPRMRTPDASLEERRLRRMERRMLEQARELSIQDAGMDSTQSSQARRRQHRSERARSRDDRNRSDGGSERDSGRRAENDRPTRQAKEDPRRRRTGAVAPLQTGHSSSRSSSGSSSSSSSFLSEEARGQRSEPPAMPQVSSSRTTTTARAIEHQSSIRSLISSSDVDFREIEQEIEDFARQITEEGLLDGMDLDNIDLTRNDELSRKITEAYRRRQAQRPRREATGRRNASTHSRRSDIVVHPPADEMQPTNRQGPTSARQIDDRSRPPVTSTHLQVRTGPARQRRRTSSSGRGATDPLLPATTEVGPAAKSQTNLAPRPQSTGPLMGRPLPVDRSISLPSASNTGRATVGPSFNERARDAHILVPPPAQASPAPLDIPSNARASRGTSKSRRASFAAAAPLPSLGLPMSPVGSQTRQQLYREPSISCSACQKPHIEYDLHYNCSLCLRGDWSLCLDCYRAGKGCQHWLGFGTAAWGKYHHLRASGNENIEPPHTLTPKRYKRPKMTPGGADGRRTLTTEDPSTRLESGAFCARCFASANDCYWMCDVCNLSDWGFCKKCVDQGLCCTHELFALGLQSNPDTPPTTPGAPHPPSPARVFTGPNAVSFGDFRPLSVITTCDLCRNTLPPTESRYHCYSCRSTVVNTEPGEYDICFSCYNNLVGDGHISSENGPGGWRRCLQGHRMVVVVDFQDELQYEQGAWRRRVVRDLVGGWGLRIEVPHEPEHRARGLQKWCWYGTGHTELERLVTRDVAASAPAGDGGTAAFPPDGGMPVRGLAKWSWYPMAGAEDELLFPKGAEVREIEDMGQGWSLGVYMGAKGLFPAPYVGVL